MVYYLHEGVLGIFLRKVSIIKEIVGTILQKGNYYFRYIFVKGHFQVNININQNVRLTFMTLLGICSKKGLPRSFQTIFYDSVLDEIYHLQVATKIIQIGLCVQKL